MSAALLRLEALDIVAGGAWLLEGISLEVVEGSTVALVGGPGAGKSLVVDRSSARRPAAVQRAFGRRSRAATACIS